MEASEGGEPGREPKEEQALNITKIYNDYIQLMGRAQAAESEIRALRMSTSWRLTQPLRAAAVFFQEAIPGFASLTRHRQMFGVRATVRRVFGIAPNKMSGSIDSNRSSSGTSALAPASLINAATAATAAISAGTARPCRSLLYVSGEPHTPGHRYRILRYIEVAREAGRKADWTTVADLSGPLEVLDSYDVMIIWRAAWNDDVARAVAYMRARARLVIFDVDDLMVEPDFANTRLIDGIRSQGLTEGGVRRHYAAVRQTMLAADFCFAATERLAFHMRAAGKSCHVLPNGFDQAAHDTSREAARLWRTSRPDNRVRIGYAGGSKTHQKDLAIAIGAVAQVLRDFPNSLLVLFFEPDSGLRLVDIEEFPALAGLEDRIEWRPLQTLEALPFEMARFDINLAPLELGNPYCESKSELKFFEAALVETPTIATPTGPFRAAIEHGKTGFLAVGHEDWLSYLRMLANRPELRARVGRQAYHAALANFGPLQRREKFARVLDVIGGGRRAAQAFALDAKLAGSRAGRPKVYESEIVFEQKGKRAAQVSVVIPLYNYEAYINETLDSIKSQTIELIDLIIVDGYSTDDSINQALGWVEKNKQRFNRCLILRDRANYGLAYCRNSGVSASDTPYFIAVDADNLLRARCCEALLETVLESKTAFAYPIIRQFDGGQLIMGAFPYDPQRLVPDNYIDAMALVSKEAWAMVGGYEHIKGGWEDYDFWARLAESGLMGVWRPEILADYRVHSASMMQTQTLVPTNRQRMHDIFKARHPWVSLGGEQANLDIPPPRPLSILPTADSARFEKLLPILRCPQSKQKLIYDGQNERLITVDGTRSWPVRRGRPIMTIKLLSKSANGEHHCPNIPLEIEDVMAGTSGLILNLNAGANQTKRENVVEASVKPSASADIIVDTPSLPFMDEVFELIVSVNTIEYCEDPRQAVAEMRRVLKPGGRLLLRTTFPEIGREAPDRLFHSTFRGMEAWFERFEIEAICIPQELNPLNGMASLASELEAALREGVSAKAADKFRNAKIEALIQLKSSGAELGDSLWANFLKLPQRSLAVGSAGFEITVVRSPDGPAL